MMQVYVRSHSCSPVRAATGTSEGTREGSSALSIPVQNKLRGGPGDSVVVEGFPGGLLAQGSIPTSGGEGRQRTTH